MEEMARGGEEDRHEDLGGDLADGSEGQAWLAEGDGEAVHLGGCQGFGGLGHGYLRGEGTWHKSLLEQRLSSSSPATPSIAKFGIY